MSEKKEDPFDGIEEEMVFDMDEDESDPALTETADFGAVLPSSEGEEPAAEEPASEEAEPAAEEPASEEAEPAAEEPASEEAEPAAEEPAAAEGEAAEDEEDTRWRFRSRSGLVLFFPTYEVATQWVIKQNPADISIAYGAGEFRPYTDFEDQLKLTGDPMTAILAEAVEGGAVEGAEPDGEPAASESSESASEASEGAEFDPAAEVTPPSGDPTEPQSSPRTTTKTSEFQFRTAKDVNVWPGRILFLVIGLLLGGGGVYYAAWYGLLPGILY